MFSIIMPSLNPDVGKIKKSIDSILANSGDFELIIIFQDTDKDKIDRIRCLFPCEAKLKILVSDAVGISLARNIGIRNAIGRWILLLDDDIYIEPSTIENLTYRLNDDVLMYYGNVKIFGTDEFYIRYFISDKDVDIWSYNRICSVALVMDKSIFKKIGYFDEKLGSGTYFGSSEESDLVIRALLNDIKIKYIGSYNVYHERAVHSLSKIERYARGSGALYKKFLYCKNYKLYIKFLLDLALRVFFLFTFQKKRYMFFKGFLDGFSKFPM